jgi:GcrA cell cycle regulator
VPDALEEEMTLRETMLRDPEAAPVAADIPRRQGLAFMQLTRRTCRWPIGDPRKEDFCFCGATSVRGRPYCELHCRIAYAPAQRR